MSQGENYPRYELANYKISGMNCRTSNCPVMSCPVPSLNLKLLHLENFSPAFINELTQKVLCISTEFPKLITDKYQLYQCEVVLKFDVIF